MENHILPRTNSNRYVWGNTRNRNSSVPLLVNLTVSDVSGNFSGAITGDPHSGMRSSLPITEIATTGANALTLANGAAGQIKIITMVVDGGDGTLTPTTFANGSTIYIQ
jgi:hypothetical protein